MAQSLVVRLHSTLIRTVPLLLGLGTILLLESGCATPGSGESTDARSSAVSSPANGVLVISAVYGSGTNFADVTHRVNVLIHPPSAEFSEFYARPEWLHADPTPGWNKALVIVYEIKGQRHIFTTGEGGKVSARILSDAAMK